MSQPCIYCSDSKHSADKSPQTIQRYAMNNQARIGSLYDSWIDNVTSTVGIADNFIIKVDVENIKENTIVEVKSVNDGNYIQIIPIEKDLWVSIALGMTSNTGGILKLYHYKPQADRQVQFLYYRRVDRQCRLLEDVEISRSVLRKNLPQTKTTHVITGITHGMDFVIALEFTKNENPNGIQHILEKVRDYFMKRDNPDLTPIEQNLLNCCTLLIFSQIEEICSLKDGKNPNEIVQSIHQYIFQGKRDFPLSYTLHSIRCFCSNGNTNGGNFIALEPTIIEKIQSTMIMLFDKVKMVRSLVDDILLNRLSEEPYCQLYKDYNQIKGLYGNIRHSLSNLVLKQRQEKPDSRSFNKETPNLQYDSLYNELDDLHRKLCELKHKDSSITQRKTDHQSTKDNVTDRKDQSVEQETLERKTMSTKNQQPPVVPSSSHQSIPPRVDSTEINVLLLGETGIGKSTMINALVNYLAFESIEQTENDRTIITIPVAFTMMSDDQLEECVIKGGEHENSNEDFDHLGQTTTQHCQSYIFKLRKNTKLRIIDTPGIGDTRGTSQDDQNIQSILSSVNHLSHLNAVCILLKPNVTRLHVLFRWCLEQIFDFLGPDARQNILFCFTNSRSTFFSPGSTIPMLKKVLNDLPTDRRFSLGKNNVFCFDSEPFRYLVARQSSSQIQFDEGQKLNFHDSWSKSVEESTRWIKSIKACSPYLMNQWHSNKDAQIRIAILVRPILETLRHYLRNDLLKNTEDSSYAVTFRGESLSSSSYLCLTCLFKIDHNHHFSMIERPIHQYRTAKEREQLPCQATKHLPILYRLKYDEQPINKRSTNAETKDIQTQLLQGCVLFANFLLHTIRVDQDPFLVWFDLFIEEERILCSEPSPKNVNKQLHKKLIDLKDQYQKQLHEIHSERKQTEAEEIYPLIQAMQKVTLINDQMTMIKETDIKIFELYEYDLSAHHPHMFDRNTPLIRSITEH